MPSGELVDQVEAPPAGVRRPRSVTIVVVLAVLQAAVICLLGLVLFLVEPGAVTQNIIESEDLDRFHLQVGGGVLVAFALVVAVFAVFVWRGSERARSVFGITQTVQIATAVYALVGQRDFGLESVWALFVPVAVLWMLYGSEHAAEFFDQ